MQGQNLVTMIMHLHVGEIVMIYEVNVSPKSLNDTQKDSNHIYVTGHLLNENSTSFFLYFFKKWTNNKSICSLYVGILY